MASSLDSLDPYTSFGRDDSSRDPVAVIPSAGVSKFPLSGAGKIRLILPASMARIFRQARSPEKKSRGRTAMPGKIERSIEELYQDDRSAPMPSPSAAGPASIVAASSAAPGSLPWGL